MTDSFIAAREDLARRRRGRVDKVTTLSAALDLVADGDHVAIGGCLYSRTPWAALMELLRKRRTGLVLSRNLMCYEGDLFLVAGASSHLLTSWMGIGLPWGVSRVMRRHVESGRAHLEEWSHLAIGLRFRAAAMGVPFLPSLTMLGSDLHRRASTEEMTCPFTGERLALIPALYPDVALVHVHRADRHGNARIEGYAHMDPDIVRAARTVIMTTEEIVEPGVFEADGARTSIPFFAVDAVVEVPFGSFPHECYGRYDADFAHFDEYVAATGDDAGVAGYLDRWVYGMPGHEALLAEFGDQRLRAAEARAAEVLS
jgi:glutaconate CoA-transferase subunit A